MGFKVVPSLKFQISEVLQIFKCGRIENREEMVATRFTIFVTFRDSVCSRGWGLVRLVMWESTIAIHPKLGLKKTENMRSKLQPSNSVMYLPRRWPGWGSVLEKDRLLES